MSFDLPVPIFHSVLKAPFVPRVRVRPTKKPVTKTELMAKFNVTYNGLGAFLQARGFRLKSTRKLVKTGQRGRPATLYLLVPA